MVLSAAGAQQHGRWRVCVCVFMRETNIASASVCVYVLFANAKASSVPPSCVSVVIRVVICTGCDTDAAAFWTASGQQNECVWVCARVCKRWQGRSYLQSPTMPANYLNKALHLYLPTATSRLPLPLFSLPCKPPRCCFPFPFTTSSPLVPSRFALPPPLAIWNALQALSFLTTDIPEGFPPLTDFTSTLCSSFLVHAVVHSQLIFCHFSPRFLFNLSISSSPLLFPYV